jgi:TolB-like protein
MFRKVLAGALSTFVFVSPVFAENKGVRVLSFSQGKDDATGEALTKSLQKTLIDKGYGTPGQMPEPAVLEELKSRSLVEGQSLDELKGFPLGADYLVSGTYAVKDDQIEATARLINIESGEVIAAATQQGAKAATDDIAKALADKLTSNLPPPAAEGKVERIDVEARGQAPGNLPGSAARTVALADAKRNAIEEAVGAVVDVTQVPDLKQVKASAQSTIRYRVLSEAKEDGKLVVRIAANVDIPADLAAKYPVPSKAISDETGYKAYIERSAKGEVNWQNGVLKVVGRAKAGAEGDAKASMLARRSAVVDAYSRAVEVVSGIRLDSDTKVSDEEKKDKALRTRIQGLVQGGKVISETPRNPKGEYEVTLEVPMRGLRGVQTVFLDRLTQPQTLKKAALDDKDDSEFTGIIIDARGTGMQAGMFPKILDESGKVVADPAATDKTILRDKGQAAFVVGNPGEGDQGWLEERLGPNPILFKAEAGASYEVASIVPFVIAQAKPNLPKGFKLGMRRQGPRPLTVKGLSVSGPTKVNLLVSTNVKDKAKFQQNLAKAFGRCKVVVVMDSQIGGTEGKLLAPPTVLQLSWR